MRLTFDEIWRSTLIIGGTALAWLVVFDLNTWLFSQAALSERVNWIFLPAALRIIFILLFQGRGAVGLIFGAYLTLPHTNPDDFSYEILLAVSSGLAPLSAVVFCQQFFMVHSELEGLNGWHIIALSIASATANAIILNALLAVMGQQLPSLEAIAAVFAGDVLGAAIVITIISFSLSGILALMKRAH